jgi:fucose 4-O-acetylase-like acetyltransferase
MIVLVLSMHACDTYSPFGNWYFTDRRPMEIGTTLFFGIYQTTLQAFFMALLFFISGYFAAPALDRKGFSRFARDRFVRLGLPTLLYMFAIGPFTQYFLSHTWGSGGFGHQWLLHLEDGQWLSETGPMWFCAALLVFSLIYGVAHQFARSPLWPPRLSSRGIAIFIGVMAAATFVVRIVIPENVAILNMHLGDFPQYLLMFGAGILAYSGDWLEEADKHIAASWSAGLLSAAVVLLMALTAFGGALEGNTAPYSGGFDLVSAGKSLWDSLVCVGMGFALIGFYRLYFDQQYEFGRFLSDNAFAVYVIHPPVLISIARMFRGIGAAPIVLALYVTIATAIVTFALSSLVLRRIPLLSDILY